MSADPILLLSRRTALIRGSAALVFAPLLPSAAVAAVPGRTFTPEAFGARGDGRSNDTSALARLAAAVNAAGGGAVSFGAGKTYLVGRQSLSERPQSRYSFEPHDILAFRGCTSPLVIRGNGARLRCAPGLRYGTFGRDGRRTDHPLPYVKGNELATPYRQMILIEDCRGPVELSELELDGNSGAHIVGGKYGDKGRQIPANGLILRNNRGSERIRNLYTHHHALDGLMIDGVTEALPGVVRELTGVRSEYNGRQGCSIIGGRGYVFRNGRFNHTGKAAIFSPPGAGVDIEAEGGKTNRDFRFIDCEFANNSGVGMAADSGDSEGALLERCKFVGATSWAAWPRKPRFRFRECLFVGPIVQCFRDPDPERAAQFHSCRFLDNPRLSPTGEVKSGGQYGPIANLGAGDLNVLFSDCEFELSHQNLLPWSRQAIYENCRMRQASERPAFPRGTYIGTNVIVGNVRLAGSTVRGTLTVNGRPHGAD